MLICRRALVAGVAATAGSNWARDLSPARVMAARREGAVVLYTSIDLVIARLMADDFRAAFPDIDLRVERSGSGRISQRVEHELSVGQAEVDVVQSSDVERFASWKARGTLARFVADDVAQYWPAQEHDPEGYFASVCAQFSVVAYNPRQVRQSEAPRGYRDLLESRWRGRLVKAHPAYSGIALASTQAVARTLGWSYLAELARQDVLQSQCSAEPPRSVVQGVRSVMADGSEAMALRLKMANAPIEVVYPVEGTPLVPNLLGVLRHAPHPNAARLLAGYMFSRRCQHLLVNVGRLRSFHPFVPPIAGIRNFDEARPLRSASEALWTQGAADTQRYRALFDI